MSGPRDLITTSTPRAKSARLCLHRRGFSIIELLVIVFVIALLLTLLLPELSSVRRVAREAASSTRVKEISAAVTAYSRDAREVFPYAAPGERVQMRDDLTISSSDPFALEYLYRGLLSSQLPWPAFREVWLSPSARRSEAEGDAGLPSYLYAWAFAARPRLWDPDHQPTASDLGASNWSAVRSPSRKVMILDHELAYVPKGSAQWIGVDRADPVAMAFVDGHAALKRPSDASSPIGNRLQADTSRRRESRVFNTRDGIAGADY